MKRLSVLALSGITLTLLLSGCFLIGIFIDPADGITMLIDSQTYAHEATYDFGLADPSGDPVVASAELANVSSVDLTVTAVTVDSDLFTVETPDLPFTLLSGETISASVEFAPSGSGPVSGTITVEVERTDAVFELSLTGGGNYAPVAQAVTEISGAGSGAVNGTYVRGSETQNGYPVYRLEGTIYRVYGWDGDGVAWVIDDDFDPGTNYYDFYSDTYSAPNAPNGEWFADAGAPPDPDSVGEIRSESGGAYEIYVGDTVSPNYVYFDGDGDPEGTTTYQWYSSDSPTGVFSPISGATSSEYVVESNAAYPYFLKVLVTPRATDGIEPGEPVWFGPSQRVYPPPG